MMNVSPRRAGYPALWLLAMAILFSSHTLAQDVPILLTNGKIITLDDNERVAESV